MEKAIYGIMLEWKSEGPRIMETSPLTLEEALKIKRVAVQRPEVIRAAVFKAVHESGNETLLPKEESNG